jgi:hypothetical protein
MILGTALSTIHRREGGKILAVLIRHFRDFDLAEEALQIAYEKALTRWRVDGLPDNPAAWLTTVAKRHALDELRRDAKTVINSEDVIDALPANEFDPGGDEAIQQSNIATINCASFSPAAIPHSRPLRRPHSHYEHYAGFPHEKLRARLSSPKPPPRKKLFALNEKLLIQKFHMKSPQQMTCLSGLVSCSLSFIWYLTKAIQQPQTMP